MTYNIIATLGEEELQDFNNPTIASADILEIRLDLISSLFLKNELSQVLKDLAKPVLFTYRNPKDSSEASSVKLIFQDIEPILSEYNSERNYLDIELDQEKSIFDSILNCRYTVIYSYHNFSNSINKEEMLTWVLKKNVTNCIYKFAITPKDFIELELFLNDLSIISKTHTIIGIAMGEIGIFSRVFGDRFGSFATYCCIGKPRAPGQINILILQKIREAYKDKPIPKLEDKFYEAYL
jgi:3-dehydroquinate dehydratase-1